MKSFTVLMVVTIFLVLGACKKESEPTKKELLTDKSWKMTAYSVDPSLPIYDSEWNIIGYTNDKVAIWNNFVRNRIIKDADKTIINKNDLIMSYQTIVNEFNSIVINNSEEYIVKDIINYTDTTYGFKGFLVKFQMIHGGNITKPLFIIDHRDKFTIQKYDKVNHMTTTLINKFDLR